MAGRRIEDKGGYPGSSDAMMKSHNHVKHYSSADGAGGIRDYPDTTEEIRRDQEKGEKHIKSHSIKPGYRY
jgi:hypothetical protein